MTVGDQPLNYRRGRTNRFENDLLFLKKTMMLGFQRGRRGQQQRGIRDEFARFGGCQAEQAGKWDCWKKEQSGAGEEGSEAAGQTGQDQGQMELHRGGRDWTLGRLVVEMKRAGRVGGQNARTSIRN